MTQHGGTYAKESIDGRDVYYARTVFAVDEKTATSSYLPAIWRVPSAGGDEVPIVRDVASYGNFAVAREGLYFESSPPGSPVAHVPMFTPFTRPEATIDFLSFATGKVTRVITLDRYAGHRFDLSADGRTLLFGQMDSFTEDLMLVENFR